MLQLQWQHCRQSLSDLCLSLCWHCVAAGYLAVCEVVVFCMQCKEEGCAGRKGGSAGSPCQQRSCQG